MTYADECRRKAEEAERLASRSYNPVEYGEHLATAKLWRERAEAAAKDTPKNA